ncbi:hypothetical protein AS188_03605 [Kocuria flava]|uniref:Uncharacterized protein n=1 Tax=Kocuria flava TaxID=446860 RepID=A0A0U3HDV4_9MICC|nr:hypothetical protein [Kocuria flava]ALU38984.1 hypothetical protein AS188_03605 [Kocuria flava]
MPTTLEFSTCAETVPRAFCEALGDYACRWGLVATAGPAQDPSGEPVTEVVLAPAPDTVFDLTMLAVREGDVPADFRDRAAPTGPGSDHHAWAVATARAYDRHRSARDLAELRRGIGTLAALHGMGAVSVRVRPVEPDTVLEQLLGIKNPA